MLASERAYNFIKQFEGFETKAYKDGGGVWTLGWGTTRFPNGYKVQEGDVCTPEEAQLYLEHDVKRSVIKLNSLLWNKPLTQNQFDALLSFEYNTGHLAGSTLYKKASVNPNDETIYKYDIKNPVDSCEFLRWVRDNGKIVKGLINRRMQEADLYAQEVMTILKISEIV